ncbi:threonine-phosphate decarboxylase CobD [Phyllobacterium meliloti]|uniref:threonine-phosphate decarboxylase CobD n=1 Tax=Phyllobacterium meliloti TaxID=555317 RepID=UPI001D13A554|nr:threonine-phosphate decarboxylase CobD [Phyllobacterium sp. T1293]UGX87986.1 threonine-phosphate decarboxylase CobD [Phyllobacterium sp. T1293]
MQIEHGGALDRAMNRFGGTREVWIDLSTGINPEVFPLPPIALEVWNRLPDEGLLASALDAARSYYGVADEAAIAAAPGTQALIQIMPDLAERGEVAIIGPTYQEHQSSFEQVGWKVSLCDNVDAIAHTAKVAVIVNPNNPDGRIVAKDALVNLAETLRMRGGFLIVDEAFADPHPETSIAAHCGGDGLIVLKSFGKFFGLAGLRLGFALTSPDIGARLTRRMGPWAVSGPALAVAKHAFTDKAGLRAFTDRLTHRRGLLSAVFTKLGLKEIGGTDLFALVEHERAHALFEALCAQHVLVRKFAYAPHWLRFGLPLDENDAETFRQRTLIALDVIRS